MQAAWTGMVPVDDTALHLRDTGGAGRAIVYLNGAYADQSHWRGVIPSLAVTTGTSPTTCVRGAGRRGRTVLAPILARNPNVQVSAKVASNHTGILRKDFRAVADAVRELAPV